MEQELRDLRALINSYFDLLAKLKPVLRAWTGASSGRSENATVVATTTCPECGTTFEPRRAGPVKKFCSGPCRQRAHRKKARNGNSPQEVLGSPPGNDSAGASNHHLSEPAQARPQGAETDQLGPAIKDIGKLEPLTGIWPPRSQEQPPAVPSSP